MIITDPVDYKNTRTAVSFSWLKLFEQDEDLFYRRFIKGEIPDQDAEESRATKSCAGRGEKRTDALSSF